MAIKPYWFIPSHGDGRALSRRAGSAAPQRAADMTYLGQVAAAADQVGFSGALLPMGMFCEDPWLVAAALAERTARLRLMVALRPSLISPMLAAQMAATAQRMSGGRLELNIVTGGDPDEQARYGDWLRHDERYEQADEFLTILLGALTGRPTDLSGRYFRVKGAVIRRPPDTLPPVFVGGSSARAQQTAARFGDTYLAWGETPGQLAELFAGARKQAAETGRALTFGSRFHVISRDTAREAWAVARELVADLDPAMIDQAHARWRRSESVGQQRMSQLRGGQDDPLEVYPNIWVGYGLLRPGPAAALVGSHEEVADRIEELAGSGVEYLILSGQPHVEEAYCVGEGVLPLLRSRGLLTDGTASTQDRRPAEATNR
jgi:alkanesulfonate monooxygenase